MKGMSASEHQRAEWIEAGFWERLSQLEGRHQRVQAAHDDARRGLERLPLDEGEQLRLAWSRYCEVIAELEQTTSEFELLHR
jgi:hypothetical protein